MRIHDLKEEIVARCREMFDKIQEKFSGIHTKFIWEAARKGRTDFTDTPIKADGMCHFLCWIGY